MTEHGLPVCSCTDDDPDSCARCRIDDEYREGRILASRPSVYDEHEAKKTGLTPEQIQQHREGRLKASLRIPPAMIGEDRREDDPDQVMRSDNTRAMRDAGITEACKGCVPLSHRPGCPNDDMPREGRLETCVACRTALFGDLPVDCTCPEDGLST